MPDVKLLPHVIVGILLLILLLSFIRVRNDKAIVPAAWQNADDELNSLETNVDIDNNGITFNSNSESEVVNPPVDHDHNDTNDLEANNNEDNIDNVDTGKEDVTKQATANNNKDNDENKNKKKSTSNNNILAKLKQQALLSSKTNNNNKRKFPSILILLADDMGYGDVNYNGGFALTPNINALAESPNSLRLDNFHSGSAVCSPSRASLLSGRNPERDCVMGAATENEGFEFRDDMPSAVRYAKRAGYKTAHIGKWHLVRSPAIVGYDYWVESAVNIPSWDPGCLCPEYTCLKTLCHAPENHCYRVTPRQCGSHLTQSCELGHLASSAELKIENWACSMIQGTSTAPNDTTPVPFARNSSASEFLANLTVKYLDTIENKQPFFLQVHFHEPHHPFFAPKWERESCFLGQTCTANMHQLGVNSLMTNFYSAIVSLDRAIGKILRKLRAMDRFSDTIVIFASDNGGEVPKFGGVPKNHFTRYLKGGKRSIYEGGIRVPAIISWPQFIKENHIINQTTSMLDFFSTLTDVMLAINPTLGDREPAPRTDGESLIPLLENPTTWQRTRPFGVCMPESHFQLSACPMYAYFEGRFKAVVTEDSVAPVFFSTPQVFDTIDDPREEHNLIASLPEHSGMIDRARAWRNSIVQEYRKFCKHIGHPEVQRTGGKDVYELADIHT